MIEEALAEPVAPCGRQHCWASQQWTLGGYLQSRAVWTFGGASLMFRPLICQFSSTKTLIGTLAVAVCAVRGQAGKPDVRAGRLSYGLLRAGSGDRAQPGCRTATCAQPGLRNTRRLTQLLLYACFTA